jgi:hypothetical protein
VINIGWYCSDRVCQMGKGAKTALIWEGLGGKFRATATTISVSSATPSESSCASLVIQPEDGSACFWTASRSSTSALSASSKRGPSLSAVFPLLGGIAAREAGKRRDLSHHHPKKHLGKVRKIVAAFPTSDTSLWWTTIRNPPPGQEIAFNMDEADRVDSFEVIPLWRNHLPCCTTHPVHSMPRRQACALLPYLPIPYCQVGVGP